MAGLQNRPARGQRGVSLAKFASNFACPTKENALVLVFACFNIVKNHFLAGQQCCGLVCTKLLCSSAQAAFAVLTVIVNSKNYPVNNIADNDFYMNVHGLYLVLKECWRAMAREIERKFLVAGDGWRFADNGAEIPGEKLVQGYLPAGDGAAFSLRVRLAGGQARLNIKSRKPGLSRSEFDLDIPYAEAEQIIEEFAAKPCIEKKRHLVPHAGHTWEVDVFSGANSGLVLAEIELESEDEFFEKPDWLGPEVSADKRYYNAFLAENPFTSWAK